MEEATSETTSSSTSSSSSSSSSSSTTSVSKAPPSTTTIISSTVISGTPSVIYKTVIATPSTTSLASSTSSTSSISNADATLSASASATAEPQHKSSVSGGTIAGAVVGSVCGVAAIAGLIFLFCWYRRRKQDQDDFDDQFTLSGPKADMTQTTGGGGIPILDSNPFLLAGGYNNFDTSQQQTPRQPSGRGSDALAVGAGAGSLSGYHKYNSSSGTSGDGNHSFGSQLHNNQDEFAFMMPILMVMIQ